MAGEAVTHHSDTDRRDATRPKTPFLDRVPFPLVRPHTTTSCQIRGGRRIDGSFDPAKKGVPRSGKQNVAKARNHSSGRSPRTACGGFRRKCYPTRGEISRLPLGGDGDPRGPSALRTFGIELISPHRSNRKKTQDLRGLRRYRPRWKIERLFAWIQNFCRLVVRYERYAE